jgi:ribonuclease HI
MGTRVAKEKRLYMRVLVREHVKEGGTSAEVYRLGWCAPPEGWVKLNTDAGFRSDNGDASTGVVVWDSHGQVLLTAWRSLRNVASAEPAEAEACLEGIQLTAEWIRQPTNIKKDCASLIQVVWQSTENRSQVVGVIAEIKRISQLLSACSFNHVRREANHVVHGLVQLALGQQRGVVMRFKAALIDREIPGDAQRTYACNLNPI